jgi:putative toxin-antitoxin system antitoxin component (TIGR02293 family)
LEVIIMRNSAVAIKLQKTYAPERGISSYAVPASSVTLLASRLGISTTTLCGYLHISTKTVQRKGDESLAFLAADKLVSIEAVVNRATEVMGSEANGISWLKTPIYALDNKAPMAYLETTRGTQIVLDLLGQIEWGLVS